MECVAGSQTELAGGFAEAGASGCILCGGGRYSDVTDGSVECTACVAGSQTEVSGGGNYTRDGVRRLRPYLFNPPTATHASDAEDTLSCWFHDVRCETNP